MEEKDQKKKRVALNIQIDADDHAYLTKQAEEKGVSVAGYVRMMIKERKKLGDS